MVLGRSEFGNLTLVPGVADIARELERVLGAAYYGAVEAVVKGWRELGPGMSPTQARAVVQDVLRSWPELTAARYAEVVDRIFEYGFMVGVLDTGVVTQPDQGDRLVTEWLKQQPQGFVPALRTFGEAERQRFEQVIEDAYRGVDEWGQYRPFDLDSMVRRVQAVAQGERWKIERVVRTETAKATAMGRLAAWQNDPDRDWYWYHWVATHDDRTKDVSLLFESGGPYSFDHAKRLWTVDHYEPKLVRNRHTGKLEVQVSSYNCRCVPARTPKEPVELFAEGLVTRAEYDAMAAAA